MGSVGWNHAPLAATITVPVVKSEVSALLKRIDILGASPNKNSFTAILDGADIIIGYRPESKRQSHLTRRGHNATGNGISDPIKGPFVRIQDVNYDPALEIRSRGLTKVFQYNRPVESEFTIPASGDPYVSQISQDIGTQLPFGSLTRMAQGEDGRNPQTDSRGSQYEGKNSNPQSEESDRVLPRSLPQGFVHLTFTVGGIVFLLTLGGMIAMLRRMGLL